MSPSGTNKLFVELGQPVSWADKKLQLQNSATDDTNFNADFMFLCFKFWNKKNKNTIKLHDTIISSNNKTIGFNTLQKFKNLTTRIKLAH